MHVTSWQTYKIQLQKIWKHNVLGSRYKNKQFYSNQIEHDRKNKFSKNSKQGVDALGKSSWVPKRLGLIYRIKWTISSRTKV